jgi:hypothetical protein
VIDWKHVQHVYEAVTVENTHATAFVLLTPLELRVWWRVACRLAACTSTLDPTLRAAFSVTSVSESFPEGAPPHRSVKLLPSANPPELSPSFAPLLGKYPVGVLEIVPVPDASGLGLFSGGSEFWVDFTPLIR